MYDKYPEYDVPEQNIIQKFFAQRWSVILIEIAMTLVISVAAGRALDPFGTNVEEPQEQAIVEPVIQEAYTPSDGIPVDVIKSYGIDYIRNQQYPEAEGMYDLAVLAEPNNVNNYAWRGYANINSGDFVEAHADYSTVIEMEENSFDGYNSLCWAHGELGEFDSALEHCDTALELASSPVEFVIAHENRCWVNVEMGDFDSAYSDCMRVFEIQPNCSYESCALAHYNLGRILLAKDQPVTAIEHFHRAYLYGSQYAQMYLDIAQVYDEMGYAAAAIASYEKYIQLAGKESNPVAQLRIRDLSGE